MLFRSELLTAYGYKKLAFANAVKDLALAIDPYVAVLTPDGQAIYTRLSRLVNEHGWTYAKGFHDVRRLLQRVGTEGGRELLGEFTWINILSRDIEPGVDYVIDDVRFLNEASWIRYGGGVIWKILRPGYNGDGHAS